MGAFPWRVPGHEIVGIFDAVGADVPDWKPGQRVGVGGTVATAVIADPVAAVISLPVGTVRFAYLLRRRLCGLHDRTVRGASIGAR